MYELITLWKVQEEREWTQVGTYVAKITTDILFKSPYMSTWNYKNSDVLNDEWGEPIDFYNGVVKELNFLFEQWGLEKIPVDPEVEARYAQTEESRLKPENKDDMSSDVVFEDVPDGTIIVSSPMLFLDRTQKLELLNQCIKYN